jgi:sec-independent protein translocase protein TatC
MLKGTVTHKKSDDLFEKSSMSFGEHLDELRRSLIKASTCLLLGLIAGIPSATYVINYLQKPLRASIEEYYEQKSISNMKEATGKEVPDDLKNWIIQEKRQSSVSYIDLQRLKSLLQPEEPLGPEEQRRAFANPDYFGLPNPDQLVAIRSFDEINAQSEALSLQEPAFIWFKASLIVAFILASPGIFYFIWEFVSAGLYPHERRYVYTFLPASLGLFLGGVLFAFFIVFPLVIGFLLQFNSFMGVGTSPRLNDYMSFALILPVGFGVAFQLPLVMLIVERLGIISVKTYIEQWRMAIFIIALVSMVLTPADPNSMIAMMIPLIFLYFLGIGLCKYLPRSTTFQTRTREPA